MRMAGTAVENTADFWMLPEVEVYLNNVLNINKVTSVLARTIAIVLAEQTHLVLCLPLVVHLVNHGSHFALMIFLRTINVEITQADNLALCLRQQTAQIVIKEQLGESVNVQRLFTGRLLAEAVRTAAIGRSGGSVHHLNLSVEAEMQHVLRILKVVFHHIFAVIFHRVRASALVENNVDFFMIKFAGLQSIHEGIFIHIVLNLQTLDIFEFDHISQVINNKNVINTTVIQAFNNITADKAGTTSYDNHNLPSLTILTIFSTTPVVE